MADVGSFQLQDLEGQVTWQFGKNKKFSVKSMYNALTKSNAGPDHKRI